MIQSRGRARQEDSAFVVMPGSNTKSIETLLEAERLQKDVINETKDADIVCIVLKNKKKTCILLLIFHNTLSNTVHKPILMVLLNISIATFNLLASSSSACTRSRRASIGKRRAGKSHTTHIFVPRGIYYASYTKPRVLLWAYNSKLISFFNCNRFGNRWLGWMDWKMSRMVISSCTNIWITLILLASCWHWSNSGTIVCFSPSLSLSLSFSPFP